MKVDKYIIANKNLKNVYDCIFDNGPINRALISKKIGLSIPSVSQMTERLISDDLIHCEGKVTGNVGKPKEMYIVASGTKHAISVDIGKGKTKIVLIDLAGNIDDKIVIKTNILCPAKEFINKICDNIELMKSKNDIKCLLGIGFGIPGIIDIKSGKVITSPDLIWKNIDVKEIIKSRFDDYVYIENSNISMTRGEYKYGAGKNSDYLLVVNLGHGIGGAFMFKGKIHYGGNMIRGEIGHVTVMKDGPMCLCGNNGCLEAVASGDAIARQAQNLVRCNIDTKILQLAKNNIENIDAKIVFDAAKLGDVPAMQLITKALEYIAICLASLINSIGVDTIVLSGGLTKNGDFVLDTIKDLVSKRIMQYNTDVVNIKFGNLEDNATCIGVGHKTLQNNLFKNIEFGANTSIIIKQKQP